MKIQNKGSSFSHLRVGSSNRVRSLLPLGAGFKGQTMLQQVLPFQFVISLNPVSLVYRIVYVCFVSMFPYFALFLARLALY